MAGPDVATELRWWLALQRGRMGDQDRTQAFLTTDVFAWREGRWLAVGRHSSVLPPGD